MHTEILNFVQRNSLIFAWAFIWRLVTFGVGSEGSQANLSSRNGTNRVNHNGNKWILKILIQSLGGNIDTWKQNNVVKIYKVVLNGKGKLLSQLLCARCDLIWNPFFLQLPHGISKLTNVLMLNSACELYGWNASNITHIIYFGINSVYYLIQFLMKLLEIHI